jgi:uncharacterized cofD-like protein
MATPRVIVLGGGNGTSRLLLALKIALEQGRISSLHALVLNADDGGSTGRLRSQYGVAAMGDLTKSLMALSGFQGDRRGEQLLEALNYRFEGGDFGGHTLRNVFLASLEKTSGLDAAVSMMARVLQLPKEAGAVPTTLKALTQQVVIERDGQQELLGEGQHFISHKVNLQVEPSWSPGQVRVGFKEGEEPLNPRASELLQQATRVIIAPGHTYGTILPTLALPALGRELARVKAKLMVVMTLLTTPKQTSGWSGEDFVRVYESYLGGKKVEVVLANTGKGEVELVEGQEWVRFKEKKHGYQLIEQEMVSTKRPRVVASDVVPRAIAVHETKVLQAVFDGIL